MAGGHAMAGKGRQQGLGRRIADYRNSVPRLVKVIGIGAAAEALAEDIAAGARGTVVLGRREGTDGPEHWPLDAPVSGVVPGAVVVVMTQSSAPQALRHRIERTAATLSVVMLDSGEAAVPPEVASLRQHLRGVADMFAATSDPEFVQELVANLAS